MSQGGCWPQLTALPDPPATLGWGVGVKQGVLQTFWKETGVLAGTVGSPWWELAVPKGVQPHPPLPSSQETLSWTHIPVMWVSWG